MRSLFLIIRIAATKAQYQASEVTVIEHPQTTDVKRIVFRGGSNVSTMPQPKNLGTNILDRSGLIAP
jgi:hypothetical protein